MTRHARSLSIAALLLTVGAVFGSFAIAHHGNGPGHIVRIDPDDVYMPYFNVYSQVVIATGTTQVKIAGTVSLDEDRNLVGEGDMALQVETTFENLRRSLAAAGATPADVVRINIFTTDVDRYLQEGAAQQGAFFGADTPASTLIGVTRLADPRYLVEIQLDAVLPPPGHGHGHGRGNGHGHGR